VKQSSPEATSPQVGHVVHRVKEHNRNFEQLIQFPRPRPWELRKKDRSYQTGDGLRVVEWDPGEQRETGREALCRISWTSDEWPLADTAVGLPSDLILLGVEVLQLVDGRPIEVQLEDLHDSIAFVESKRAPGPPVPYTPQGIGLPAARCPALRCGVACVLPAAHSIDCVFEAPKGGLQP